MESAYNCMDKHSLGYVSLALQPHHFVVGVFGVAYFSLWFQETTNIRTYSAMLVCFTVPKYRVKGELWHSRGINAVPHHRKLKFSMPLMADSRFFMFVFLVEELRLWSDDTTGEDLCAALDILHSDPAFASIVWVQERSGTPPAVTGSRLLDTTGCLADPLERTKLELGNCKHKTIQNCVYW